MDKRTYYIEAIQSKAYIQLDWVISILTTTDFEQFNTGDELRPTHYSYKLYSLNDEGSKVGFLDPNGNEEMVVIDDYHKMSPVIDYTAEITVKLGDLQNVVKTTKTTYGNVLLNAVLLCHNFGNIIEFKTGKLRGSDFDAEVARRLVDDPVEGESIPEGKVSVSQLISYQNATMYIGQFSLVCAPGCSPKSLIPNPVVTARREELLKEYGDSISDPAVLAKVEAELIALDKEGFKDDPAYGFVSIGKSFTLTRKKKFTMIGMEEGFGSHEIITKPLVDGFDAKNMPAYINTLRSGSHSRGALTALGGVEVKRANQIFQSVKIAEDDCGVKFGKMVLVDQPKRYNGIWMVDGGKPVLLTGESAKAHLGKIIQIRTPQTCKTVEPDYCAKCVGTQIASRPDGVHVTIGGPNSVMMYAFMGAMHGKSLTTHRYDIHSAFM